MSTVEYRLRIRDAADTTDVLVVSSVRGDTLPYLVEAPSGDGAEFDPFTGSYRSGSSTYRIADGITSGTSRVVTSLLEDSTFRQQLTSRPAYGEERIDGGSWVVRNAGIVTGIRLSSAAVWDIDVGDATRATRNLVAFAPKRDASDATKVEPLADYLARWPKRGCILGGPIIGGAFGRADLGGWEFRVRDSHDVSSSYDLPAGATFKYLEFAAGYDAPGFGRSTNADVVSNLANDAAGPMGPKWGHPIFAADLPGFSAWPDLVVQVGSQYFAAATFDDFTSNTDRNFFVHNKQATGLFVWDVDDVLSVSNDIVRVRVFDAVVSARCPLYYSGHPVDLWTALCDDAGLAYDATAVTTTKNALGTNRRINLRIDGPQPWASFVENTLYGPCGFSVRTGEDGTLVPFPTRITSSDLPAVEVTNADVPQAGTVLFDLSEPDAITKVTFNQTQFIPTDERSDQSSPPLDGIRTQSVTVERTSGDAGGPVQRELSYTIPGFIDSGSGSYEPEYFDVFAAEIFDRAGRGRLSGELALLRDGSAGDVVLGDEVLVSLRAMPNHNKRLGDDDSVGGRCVQILRLTPTAWGAMAKFMDSGPNAQPASPLPTITLAAGPAGAGVALTITNAATLNTAGIAVRIQWAPVASGTPASEDYTDVLAFAAGAVPTGAVLLPLAPAGYTVYVQGRSEQANKRPSAYSTPVSRTTTALAAPTDLTATPVGIDGSLCGLTWTNGSEIAWVDVFLRKTADSATADVRVITLEAESVAYTLWGLTPGDNYTASVEHRDPATGATSDKTTVDFTAGSTTVVLPAPTNPRGIVGSTDATTGVGFLDGTYGLDVTAAVLPGFITFWEAVEDSPAAGTFGSFTQVSGLVPAVSGGPTRYRAKGANNLLERQLKARHEADGMTASAYTDAVTLDAWGVVLSPPDYTRCTISDVRRADTATDSTFTFTLGDLVAEVWAAYLVVTAPRTESDWDDVTAILSPLADGVTTFTAPRPADQEETLVELVSYFADGTVGMVKRLTLSGLPQVPTYELDDAETATTGTQFVAFTERGLAITSVQMQTQTGSNPITAFGDPTRSEGDASVVRGGTLAAGEYEFDVTLDSERQSWVVVAYDLENGSRLVLPPFAFDRDKRPDIVSVVQDGTTLTITADSDTKSIGVYRYGASWGYEVDGKFAVVDVAGDANATGYGNSVLVSGGTDNYTIRAYSDPIVAIVTSGDPALVTQTTERQVTIYNAVGDSGGTGAPAATWLVVTAYAPSTDGSTTAQIALKASAAPTDWTARISISEDGSAPSVDETANLTPSLSAPPTTQTSYDWTAAHSSVPRDTTTRLVTMRVLAELLDDLDAVRDSREVTTSWYSADIV